MRRHDQPVRERQVAQAEGLEQRGAALGAWRRDDRGRVGRRGATASRQGLADAKCSRDAPHQLRIARAAGCRT